MTNNNSSDQSFETNLEDLNWKRDGIWSTYPFNFGSASPAIGEINEINDAALQYSYIDSVQHFLYRTSQSMIVSISNEKHESVDEAVILFCVSGINPGHLLSEMISFVNLYLKYGMRYRVAIAVELVLKSRYLYELLKKMLPLVNILVLASDKIYFFKKIILRRNRWFIATSDWQAIEYSRQDNLIALGELRELRFSDDLMNIKRCVEKIYINNHSRYELKKNIFLIKTNNDVNLSSAHRAMFVSDSIRDQIEAAGYDLLKINDFADIVEYICRIYHAENIVTSYGAIACANRFFVNSEANVLVLAHTHYEKEYLHSPDLWHPLHSHTFPVRNQNILLNYPNEITLTGLTVIFDALAIGNS
jgi:hypothetical protein